jgi:hypothetical protein
MRHSLSFERSRRAQFVGFALAMAFAGAAAVIACGGSTSSGGSGGDYCARASDYARQCNKNDACTQAALQNCASLESSLSAAAQSAILACVTPPYECNPDGGPVSQAVNSCEDAHLAAATPTAAQAQVKADFCKQCPDSASMFVPNACSNFFVLGDGGSGAGGIVLLVSDNVASQIDRQCTGASASTEAGFGDCGLAFIVCAAAVFDSGLPKIAACSDGGLTGRSARLPIGLSR